MIVLATLAIFLAAAVGIVFFTVQAFRFLGQALNRRRPLASRRLSALVSAASALAIVLSSAGGFVGITSVWFYAQKAAAPAAQEQAR